MGICVVFLFREGIWICGVTKFWNQKTQTALSGEISSVTVLSFTMQRKCHKTRNIFRHIQQS
jgi:hypothetical protein